MKQGKVLLIGALAATFMLAFAGLAGGKIKKKTFSSGSIATEFGDFESATQTFTIGKKRSKVKDVDVKMRVRSSCPGVLDIVVTGPTGTAVDVSSNNGNEGCEIPPGDVSDAYGVGSANCGGTFAEFNDEAETPITQTDQAPYAGQFVPESPLSVFDGKKLKGTWQVSVTDDDNFGDTSVLHCAELEIKYKKKKKRK